jgi:hypothetical protein
MVIAACDPAQRSVAPAPVAAQPSAAPRASSFLEAVGVGATEVEAHAAALAGLAQALFGAAAWADVMRVDVYDPQTDPRRVQTSDSGVFEVTLGLSRSRAAAVLSAASMAQPQVTGPAIWRDTVYAFLYAHVGALVCERRRALFSVQCEPGDTTEADGALEAMARQCSLVGAYVGGVPLDTEGHLVRAPGIYALCDGVPVADVPVVASSGVSELRQSAQTDARGRAGFEAFARDLWTGPIRVGVDASAVLGPLHETWPNVEVILEARPIGSKRWTGLVSQGARADEGFSAALAEALESAGLEPPVSVRAEHASTLLQASAQSRPEVFSQVAEVLGGRVDLVLVSDVQSQFAARMGGSRVWYEARGVLFAHDAWSGRVLARVEATAEASGVGDARADRAARQKLAQMLAKRWLETMEVPALRLTDAQTGRR